MLQMESLVLCHFLLVLRIPLNFGPDANDKCRGFSETLLEKGLEFSLSNGKDILAFYISFVLLPTKVNSIPNKKSRKRDTFGACGISCDTIIYALLTKVVILYVQVIIIEVCVFALEKTIAKYGICLQLAMLLISKK